MASLEQRMKNIYKIISQSSEIGDSIPARYNLNPSAELHDKSQPYRQKTFGERNDNNKPHKTILLVGETGTGKTTLINVMINYMLGVKREDKVWFEITDELTSEQMTEKLLVQSQTSSITIYGFYLQESPIDLTIIDTPGYGDTRDINNDKEIAMSLLNLSRCDNSIHEIHAVCLVINSTQNRLSHRQIYIFDAVQSLFGKDIAENIVLLFTHSAGQSPKNALMAVKVAKLKCAENDKNQPVYYLFNNCQSESAEEDEMIQKLSWDRSYKGMENFFKFVENIKPKTLLMTRDVLQQRNQLESKIFNLRSRVQEVEQKHNELEQTKEALKKNEEYVKDEKNFEYEVEVQYKERVDIDPKRWRLTKKATCCTVCEENCHYPGCWWAKDLSWCSMMKDDHCTVCSNKCHYSKHIKEAKIYESKTKKEKRTYEDLKKKYNVKIYDTVSVATKLEEELKELEKEKIKLVIESFDCVETLELIALNTDSLLTLQHIDFLIEKLKEINEPEKAKTLEDIKKRAGEEKQGALGYIKCLIRKK